jgi:Tol biopolymer transport system component
VKPGTDEAAGNAERLAEWKDSYPMDLSISTDGKRLSFLRNRDWDDVYLGELALDGAQDEAAAPVYTRQSRIWSLDNWTPDSHAILFSCDRNGRSEVFRRRLKASVAETLVQGSQADYNSGPDVNHQLQYRQLLEPGLSALL